MRYYGEINKLNNIKTLYYWILSKLNKNKYNKQISFFRFFFGLNKEFKVWENVEKAAQKTCLITCLTHLANYSPLIMDLPFSQSLF